ncbi:exodeoxyribonuclease V subunit beta [Snodgrassella sp. CFCC 13594]|uniref:exodeoxyribonuclease V subunit beta n=1 Tax=Snodgrassella sp. CFCC 13594 TaxID=1775559 RepID=UPI000831C502|nr:exodeoxyribonuclease V subunit beta [Snodgrassella sp. CFCC 13594]
MPQPFNPITLPLHGISLIEASAGTGKTYNIAALFARLVLLEHKAVERILVVTFTKAATAELKTRLRARLNDALSLLQNRLDEDNPPDEVLLQLIAAARQQESDDQLILRLQAAINQFDGAAIYTIHGFCQRVLTDYAFLCQCPFDTETAEADPKLLRTFAEDFWRRHVSHDATLAPLVAEQGLTPHHLVKTLGAWVNRADLQLRPAGVADLAERERTLQDCWQRVAQTYDDIQAAFWRLHPKLNGNSYRQATFNAFFTELQVAVATQQPLYAFTKHDKFVLFEAPTLHEKTKKGQILDEQDVALLAPLAAFGTAYLTLKTAQQAALLQLQLACFDYMRQAMVEHKRNSHRRSFDDLLADVANALSPQNPQANALAAALSRDWHIALIDECQDTDPLQYRLFKTAFAEQGRPLIMVGDPKQAIYSFRGADIHAYLQAAADTPPSQRYTLSTNYRSHQPLVQSISHLFGGKAWPFVLEGIRYTAVQAHREHTKLTPAVPALSVRWLHEVIDVNDKGKETLPSKEMLRQRAANWCADEVANTLQSGFSGKLKLNHQPIQAGDIAVLVRTHNEGKLVASALKMRGVVSVSLDNQSVFASLEAAALNALLQFWLHPQRTETLRYVLGGVLYGWTAGQLTQLNADETTLDQWLSWAQQAREYWQQKGIYSALVWFANITQMESQLLMRRAERSLTNFWQLAELLADAEVQLPSPTALAQWLHTQSQPDQRQGEEALLRLESDEHLVKIVTMHAAKGLEYPIVFCPFVWDGKDATQGTWVIIHRDGQAELVHKDGLSEADKDAMLNDAMGEMLRLYYVAFTRAREQLILYAGAGSNLVDNPFSYLLDGHAEGSLAQSRAYWEAHKDQRISSLYAAWQHCLNTAAGDTDIHWFTGRPTQHSYCRQPYPSSLIRPCLSQHDLLISCATPASQL